MTTNQTPPSQWKFMLAAARFARKAHHKQCRANGSPYFNHVKAVARILWDDGHRLPQIIAAAYLHDTIEDTSATMEQLVASFGFDVAYLVGALTRMKGVAHADYYRAIKNAGQVAMILKLADSKHNSLDLVNSPPEYNNLRKKTKSKARLMRKIFFSN